MQFALSDRAYYAYYSAFFAHYYDHSALINMTLLSVCLWSYYAYDYSQIMHSMYMRLPSMPVLSDQLMPVIMIMVRPLGLHYCIIMPIVLRYSYEVIKMCPIIFQCVPVCFPKSFLSNNASTLSLRFVMFVFVSGMSPEAWASFLDPARAQPANEFGSGTAASLGLPRPSGWPPGVSPLFEDLGRILFGVAVFL